MNLKKVPSSHFCKTTPSSTIFWLNFQYKLPIKSFILPNYPFCCFWLWRICLFLKNALTMKAIFLPLCILLIVAIYSLCLSRRPSELKHLKHKAIEKPLPWQPTAARIDPGPRSLGWAGQFARLFLEASITGKKATRPLCLCKPAFPIYPGEGARAFARHTHTTHSYWKPARYYYFEKGLWFLWIHGKV